jgi:hypothetical protein
MVERAYFCQPVPRDLKASVLILIGLDLLGAYLALTRGDPVTILVLVCWGLLTWFLYLMVVQKQYWAYLALIVVTLPFGLFLAASREVRLYYLQK